MSTQENKAVITRHFDEVWNKGNIDVSIETLSTDYIRRDPNTPDATAGLDSYRQVVTTYRTAFPDLHFTLEDQIAEADLVSVRWKASGTHKGQLANIPPTGKSINVTGMSICRFADGKIVESWESWDALGMLQQLGVIPPMG